MLQESDSVGGTCLTIIASGNTRWAQGAGIRALPEWDIGEQKPEPGARAAGSAGN